MRSRDAWRAIGGLVALAFVVGLGALAWLVAQSPVRAATAPTPQGAATVSDAAVDDGRALYLQSCASCHGPQAEGAALGPSLTGSGVAAWDFMLRTGRMPAGAPDEPGFRQEPRFDEQQIGALLAFAQTVVTSGPDIPEVTVDPRLVGVGFEAYIQNCAACHAATGVGDSVGGGFIAPSLLESEPRIVAEAVLIGPGAMPEFPFLADEIDAIATYVETLKGPAGSHGGLALSGLGPVAEGFVAIFFGLGALVVVARFVERGDR